jgi:hypothetical protein
MSRGPWTALVAASCAASSASRISAAISRMHTPSAVRQNAPRSALSLAPKPTPRNDSNSLASSTKTPRPRPWCTLEPVLDTAQTGPYTNIDSVDQATSVRRTSPLGSRLQHYYLRHLIAVSCVRVWPSSAQPRRESGGRRSAVPSSFPRGLSIITMAGRRCQCGH